MKQHPHPFMEAEGRNFDALRALEDLGDPFHDPLLLHANHEQPPSSGANSHDPLVHEGVAVSPTVLRPESQLLPSLYRGGSTVDNNGLGRIGYRQFTTAGAGFIHEDGGWIARFGHTLEGTLARNHAGSETLVAVRDSIHEDAEFLKLFSMGHLKEAMTDPMASRVFQDKIGHCSLRLREYILVLLCRGHVPLVQVCCNLYGTRSLQKLFEYLSTFEERRFAAMTLSTMVTSLFKDLHGQRVIEFCLNNFSTDENKSIFKEVSRHLLEIATNKVGCFTLTKCIQTMEGCHRNVLLVAIEKNSIQLALDPHGNYLVPKLFEYNVSYATSYMLWGLRGSYHPLSADKFGSYVVEKCLTYVSRTQFETIACELIGGPNFTELFTHPYGNYIVQSMLSSAKYWGVFYDELKVIIENKQEQLRCDPYGSKVLGRLHAMSNRKIRTTSVDRR